MRFLFFDLYIAKGICLCPVLWPFFTAFGILGCQYASSA